MAAKVKALQQWCKMQCDGYRDVNIVNMTSSWKSGLAFCAIIHRYRPDLIDYNSLSKENVFQNNKLAFDVAQQLGIPALLDAEDMVVMTVPDKLCIITYVSQYYNFFRNYKPAAAPMKRHLPEDASNATAAKKAIVEKPVLEENKMQNSSKRHTLEDTCYICQGKVFLMERQIEGKKLYHRHCLRNMQKEQSSTLRSAQKPDNLQKNGLEMQRESMDYDKFHSDVASGGRAVGNAIQVPAASLDRTIFVSSESITVAEVSTGPAHDVQVTSNEAMNPSTKVTSVNDSVVAVASAEGVSALSAVSSSATFQHNSGAISNTVVTSVSESNVSHVGEGAYMSGKITSKPAQDSAEGTNPSTLTSASHDMQAAVSQSTPVSSSQATQSSSSLSNKTSNSSESLSMQSVQVPLRTKLPPTIIPQQSGANVNICTSTSVPPKPPRCSVLAEATTSVEPGNGTNNSLAETSTPISSLSNHNVVSVASHKFQTPDCSIPSGEVGDARSSVQTSTTVLSTQSTSVHRDVSSSALSPKTRPAPNPPNLAASVSTNLHVPTSANLPILTSTSLPISDSTSLSISSFTIPVSNSTNLSNSTSINIPVSTSASPSVPVTTLRSIMTSKSRPAPSAPSHSFPSSTTPSLLSPKINSPSTSFSASPLASPGPSVSISESLPSSVSTSPSTIASSLSAPKPAVRHHISTPVIHPISTPAVHPVSSPVINPVSTQVIHPISTPAIHPISTPAVYPISTPAVHPISTPAIHPISTPAIHPISTPAVHPVSSPVIHPISTPAVHPISTPAVHPISTPAIHPISTPTVHPISTPAVHPVSTPVIHPVSTTAGHAVCYPVQVPANGFDENSSQNFIHSSIHKPETAVCRSSSSHTTSTQSIKSPISNPGRTPPGRPVLPPSGLPGQIPSTSGALHAVCTSPIPSPSSSISTTSVNTILLPTKPSDKALALPSVSPASPSASVVPPTVKVSSGVVIAIPTKETDEQITSKDASENGIQVGSQSAVQSVDHSVGQSHVQSGSKHPPIPKRPPSILVSKEMGENKHLTVKFENTLDQKLVLNSGFKDNLESKENRDPVKNKALDSGATVDPEQDARSVRTNPFNSPEQPSSVNPEDFHKIESRPGILKKEAPHKIQELPKKSTGAADTSRDVETTVVKPSPSPRSTQKPKAEAPIPSHAQSESTWYVDLDPENLQNERSSAGPESHAMTETKSLLNELVEEIVDQQKPISLPVPLPRSRSKKGNDNDGLPSNGDTQRKRLSAVPPPSVQSSNSNKPPVTPADGTTSSGVMRTPPPRPDPPRPESIQLARKKITPDATFTFEDQSFNFGPMSGSRKPSDGRELHLRSSTVASNHNQPVVKRKVNAEDRLSAQYITGQLQLLDSKLKELEKEGRTLEDKIRSGTDESMDDDDKNDLMSQWFEMINHKNDLVRHESELIYRCRQQELEDKHEEVEFELRCLMNKPDHLKTANEKKREEVLLQKLLQTVSQRNNIIESMEEDRIRYLKEDEEIAQMLTTSGLK